MISVLIIALVWALAGLADWYNNYRNKQIKRSQDTKKPITHNERLANSNKNYRR